MATIVNPSDESLRDTSPRLITVSLATNLLFAGNVTGTVNGVTAADITSSITNFNNSNDQNGTPIAAPTVVTPATHTSNADGAVNVRFAWTWGTTAAESGIDGFIVYTLSRTSSAAYTFTDTAQADEVLTVLPASRRAHTLYGVPATNYYSFGIRAYRRVNTSVTSSGVIFSSIAQTTTNFPYRPSSVVNIDIGTGQLNGAGIGSYQNSNINLGVNATTGTITLNNAGGGSLSGIVNPSNKITLTSVPDYIGPGAITGPYIAELAIGSAQIANTIQSTPFNTTQGWQINKGGTATFNQANIRGQLNVGDFSGWEWPATGGGGVHISETGVLIGNYTDRSWIYYEKAAKTIQMGTINSTITLAPGWDSLQILSPRFKVYSDGSGEIDRLTIKRRPVLQTGSVDPGEYIISGYGAPEGTAWRGQITLNVPTSPPIYDAAAAFDGSLGQQYGVSAVFTGAFRNWDGQTSSFYMMVVGKPTTNRTFSNAGATQSNNQIFIMFDYHVVLLSGNFNQFRLPIINWSLYTL